MWNSLPRCCPATGSSPLSAFSSELSTGWFASHYLGPRRGALVAYLSEQTRASAKLEVLACIVFKQPISQSEIEHLFDADKRGLVVTLRDLKLVEEFAGADGRLRFATT
jgi:chromosome segregation and condensation protein ScpB